MGQKLSMTPEEEYQFYNLLQGGQINKSSDSPQAQPAVMMRMMAPTALSPQQHVIQPAVPPGKQRVMQPAVPARKRRVKEPAAKVRQAPVRQAQRVGQYR